MKLLAEITFRRVEKTRPYTMYFYEYKGVHFRDLLYLDSEEEIKEALSRKVVTFENLESSYMNFHAIAKDRNAKILEEKFLKPEYKEEIYALKS